MNFPRLSCNRSWIHGHHAVSILKTAKQIEIWWHFLQFQHRPFTPKVKRKSLILVGVSAWTTAKCCQRKVFFQKKPFVFTFFMKIVDTWTMYSFEVLNLPTIKIFRRLQNRWKSFRFFYFKISKVYLFSHPFWRNHLDWSW